MQPRVICSVVAILFVSGCASRPSAEELAQSIRNASLEDPASDVSLEHANCVADYLLNNTELSDTTLSGLTQDFATPKILGTETGSVVEIVNVASAQCSAAGATAEAPAPSTTVVTPSVP